MAEGYDSGMKVMLGSGGFRGIERRDSLCAAMRQHFGEIGKLLFVPYALEDGDDYVNKMVTAGYHADYELVGIHSCPDLVQAVEQAEGIYVGGGNTFRLIDQLQKFGLIEVIRRRVCTDGLPYLGVSAGSNVACPTMMTTNDMPIVHPTNFAALDLVPFQINTHYYPGQIHIKMGGGEYHEHFGETRDDRIREFHERRNEPVIGLFEAGWLLRTGDKLSLHQCPARLFQKGEEPVDLAPGADLGELLH